MMDRYPWFRRLAAGLLPIAMLFGGLVIHRHWEAAVYAPRLPRRLAGETEVTRKDNWRVALIGDTRSNNEVTETGLRLIAADRVDATIFLGDLVSHPSRDKMMDFAIEIGESMKECPGIGQLFFLPGNHDRDSRSGLALYEKYFGRPYQAVRVGTALFLLLDNSSESISAQQRLWIIEKLKQADEQGLAAYLCMHHPPRGSGVKKDDMTPESSEFLAQAIKSHPAVKAVFASHLHAYTEGSFAGVPLYVTGGGGAHLEKGAEFHYLLVKPAETGGAVAVTYREIPDPGNHLARHGPTLYYLEAMSVWVYWLGAVLFSAPFAAWTVLRVRAAGKPRQQAGPPQEGHRCA